jgi:hypothetical protein
VVEKGGGACKNPWRRARGKWFPAPFSWLLLSGGGTVVFPGRRVEAQEDPQEVVDPVRRGTAGPEGVLQTAVEAFHHPVGLRVVGGGLVVLDVEQTAEGGPQGGAELGPVV